jgi:pimeloyl-ACP methyl ester carboxylesterase
MIHGQPGLGSDFEDVASLLAGDFEVHCPDRPGYGSNFLPPMSVAENSEWLAELIADSGRGKAIVVGHSYGGGVAALLAARHGELISGLVLVSSIGPVSSIGSLDRLLAMPVLGDGLSGIGLYAAGQLFPHLRHELERIHASGPRKTLLERIARTLPQDRLLPLRTKAGRRMLQSFIAEQRTLVKEIDEIDKSLRRIKVPTVVISGTRDMVVSPTHAIEIAATVDSAWLVSVAAAGHFIPGTSPKVVESAVRFLGNSSDSSGRQWKNPVAAR